MTHDPKLVEAVARAIYDACDQGFDPWKSVMQRANKNGTIDAQAAIEAFDAATAALDTLATLGALVPPGWQAVPVEANKEMCRAAGVPMWKGLDQWKHMVAAAPKPGDGA